MDLPKLRAFLAVAEELHFRRAARRLGLSQPALSHQVARLEEELGVKLLDRSRQHVELTAAGRTLQAGALPLLESLERLIQETCRVGDALQRRLVLGYVEYMNLPFLPTALRTLQDEHPDAEIVHRELYPSEALAALGERTIDLGFAFKPVDRTDLVTRTVLIGRWLVVLPQGHPLAALPEVPLAELAGEPLILFARHINPPLYDWWLQQCRAAGFEPRITYRTAQAHVGPHLVLGGVGVFLVGSYVLHELPEGTVARPLTGFAARIEIVAAWRPDNNAPLLRAFRAVLPRRPLVSELPGVMRTCSRAPLRSD